MPFFECYDIVVPGVIEIDDGPSEPNPDLACVESCKVVAAFFAPNLKTYQNAVSCANVKPTRCNWARKVNPVWCPS